MASEALGLQSQKRTACSLSMCVAECRKSVECRVSSGEWCGRCGVRAAVVKRFASGPRIGGLRCAWYDPLTRPLNPTRWCALRSYSSPLFVRRGASRGAQQPVCFVLSMHPASLVLLEVFWLWKHRTACNIHSKTPRRAGLRTRRHPSYDRKKLRAALDPVRGASSDAAMLQCRNTAVRHIIGRFECQGELTVT